MNCAIFTARSTIDTRSLTIGTIKGAIERVSEEIDTLPQLIISAAGVFVSLAELIKRVPKEKKSISGACS